MSITRHAHRAAGCLEAGAAQVRCVATGNPGCLMQIGAGAIVHRVPLVVIHPVELLDARLRPRERERAEGEPATPMP